MHPSLLTINHTLLHHLLLGALTVLHHRHTTTCHGAPFSLTSPLTSPFTHQSLLTVNPSISHCQQASRSLISQFTFKSCSLPSSPPSLSRFPALTFPYSHFHILLFLSFHSSSTSSHSMSLHFLILSHLTHTALTLSLIIFLFQLTFSRSPTLSTSWMVMLMTCYSSPLP